MTLAAVSLFVLSIAGLAIAAAVLVRLPPDYLKRDRAAYPRREASSWLRIILRSFLGVLLIAIGVVLSIPGVPGQGLVVGLAGLLLLDFPGKRSLICRLLSQQLLLRAVNRLRRRFSQPPLEKG